MFRSGGSLKFLEVSMVFDELFDNFFLTNFFWRIFFWQFFFDEFYWWIFLTIFCDGFFWRSLLKNLFWRTFLTIFLTNDECFWWILIFRILIFRNLIFRILIFRKIFLTYNLLTIASFRIGVPSILFFSPVHCPGELSQFNCELLTSHNPQNFLWNVRDLKSKS